MKSPVLVNNHSVTWFKLLNNLYMMIVLTIVSSLLLLGYWVSSLIMTCHKTISMELF